MSPALTLSRLTRCSAAARVRPCLSTCACSNDCVDPNDNSEPMVAGDVLRDVELGRPDQYPDEYDDPDRADELDEP